VAFCFTPRQSSQVERQGFISRKTILTKLESLEEDH